MQELPKGAMVVIWSAQGSGKTTMLWQMPLCRSVKLIASYQLKSAWLFDWWELDRQKHRYRASESSQEWEWSFQKQHICQKMFFSVKPFFLLEAERFNHHQKSIRWPALRKSVSLAIPCDQVMSAQACVPQWAKVGRFFCFFSSAETFPKTIIDSENGAWETPFLFGKPYFSGAKWVSGRVVLKWNFKVSVWFCWPFSLVLIFTSWFVGGV